MRNEDLPSAGSLSSNVDVRTSTCTCTCTCICICVPVPRAGLGAPTLIAGAVAVSLFFLGAACGNTKATPTTPTTSPSSHVIEIDVDDHGLSGLWMANAPNLKGLIARGALAYSRVLVPTHSNHNNMSLLTGQYPEADNVPSNSWLSRGSGFAAPVSLPGLAIGDYAVYAKNPLLVRGDSVYRATRGATAVPGPSGPSGYFGQLPPFEAGADEVHLTIVGAQIATSFGALTVTAAIGAALLTDSLGYPQAVVDRYHFVGPAAAGESYAHFTLREAARYVRATAASQPMLRFMFIWDFLALDDDPTSVSGANGPGLVAVIEEYDQGLGDLLSALTEKDLLDDTNIIFTLDHGKVDAHNQVVLGTRGGGGSLPADGQLGAVVAQDGEAVGLTTDDYAMLNEDGDALIYARVPGAGTSSGADRQQQVTGALLSLIQSGKIVGLDTSRTMTADGGLGTRRFQDFRASGPNQADIIVFPLPDWTLNQVDTTNQEPGPFKEHTQFPYGRHGGFSADELYVPLILAGPAFKQGVVLPHPVEHAQVASTAIWALGGGARLSTAARGPIAAALAGDPGETLPAPDAQEISRDTILALGGYANAPVLSESPALSAVIIDVAGLYDDEVFNDPVRQDDARALREIADRGVRFEDFWTHSRDWPVNEYEFLIGGRPTANPGIATAEDDPAQTVAPAAGLLMMPPVPGFVANRTGFEAWRQPDTVFSRHSLLGAARDLGLTTAVVGEPDFHTLHLDPSDVDLLVPADLAGAAASVRGVLMDHPRSLILVTIGGPRTGDRHAVAAGAELAEIGAAVAGLVEAAGPALVVVTSRGATPIDDPAADFYGPGTSRHVPFVLLGPNVRPAVVSGQPGSPADLPATVLMGLGAPMTGDLVNGTWASGVAVGGISQPLPQEATAGHALVRAFAVAE